MKEQDARPGIGQWDYFFKAGYRLEDIAGAAADWNKEVGGIQRPWLVWNVHPDWCLVQQRLVESAGWTPVVGGDPKYERPPIIKNAVWVDFNQRLKLPMMYPHFVFEFTFMLDVPRLAFWHSDLLLRRDQMRHYADMFASLPNGSMAAVEPEVGLWTKLFRRRELRFWELLGCMTAGASRDNWTKHCGWWCAFQLHPRCPPEELALRKNLHWECGVGIRYWRDRYNADVRIIPEREVAAGHFTRINNKRYVGSPGDWRRDLQSDLSRNFDLADACRKMGLEGMLPASR